MGPEGPSIWFPPYYDVLELVDTVPARAENYVVQAPVCPAPEWTASVGGAAVNPASPVHATGTNIYPPYPYPPAGPNVLFTNTVNAPAQVRVWTVCQYQ